jgi:cbb3-type cytochrome oxidase maturation protein
MEVLFMLIGFSLLIALLFLGAFFWAVRSGQYEDRYTPSIRMLFDNLQVRSAPTVISKTSIPDSNQESNKSGEKINAE